MKVQVTVTAQFPTDMPYDVIEKLARENGHPIVIKNATVSHGVANPPDGAAPRRIVEWKSDCVNLQHTTSEDVFQVQVRAAAERGIKLERRIRRLEPDGSPAEEMEPKVFWTWGKEV